MNLYTGKMTSKGQTTIPVEVRDFLGLKPGDRIRYIRRGDEIIMKPKNRRMVEFAGMLRDETSVVIAPEDMEDAIADAVASHVMGDHDRS